MQEVHFNLYDILIVKRSDGANSKRYRHWYILCKKDRGYGYKNKVIKESFCHSCKMKQPDVLQKISINSAKHKHTTETKEQISKSLYNKYSTNPINRKISKNLRARLNKALKTNAKTGSAVSDLGCSIAELKMHLEAKFESGMTWENYGITGWHIDHIIPLCSFVLSDKTELKKACHYTNLQPLWAEDNLKKRHVDGTFR